MAEEDIKKTVFRIGSSGLCKFTQMPFGLPNAGLSFCHFIEQCLRDQQFITLLLYLNYICISASEVDIMLDQIKMVFDGLRDCCLKSKPKKSHLFQLSMIVLGHVPSMDGISANLDKVDKVKN